MVRLAPVALLLLAAAIASPADARGRPTIGSDSAACDSGEGPAIRVDVAGLKDRKGRLKLELYPANATDFLRDDRDLEKEGKVFRRIWADLPTTGPVELCIKVPHPGSYGLFFTHDRDGKNKFNFWTDGGGITSNTRIGMSKPKFTASTVEVGPGITTITIQAQYLRGLSGLSPLKK
ncbi:MAG: DUF2141 domain-containing protein [Sphingomonas sp.]|nr:DUF2141 domain-containing protein [Sphingomonas sp.]